MKPCTPGRFYLITYPRTGSNVLLRMLGLERQPRMRTGDDRGGYIFLPVIKLITDLHLRKKEVTDWTEEETAQVKCSYQECFDGFLDYLDKASRDGCSVFIKEHVHFLINPTTLSRFTFGNPVEDTTETSWTVQHLSESAVDKMSATLSLPNETILPDKFLRSWQPTFLIRHPALAFPSLYRVLLELEGTGNPREDEQLGQHCMTLRWTRRLYEWYVRESICTDKDTIWPLVLDADDIMADPGLVKVYCQLLGMDSSRVSCSWTPVSTEQLAHMDLFTRRYLSTLLASEGVIVDKAAGDVDIEREAEMWCREFGERAGRRIERLVWESMPDYEFLKARRLRAESCSKGAIMMTLA